MLCFPASFTWAMLKRSSLTVRTSFLFLSRDTLSSHADLPNATEALTSNKTSVPHKLRAIALVPRSKRIDRVCWSLTGSPALIDGQTGKSRSLYCGSRANRVLSSTRKDCHTSMRTLSLVQSDAHRSSVARVVGRVLPFCQRSV
ncbi:hypothetical protein BJV78DRAFT_1170700 [Lactifluus subvellereus]|nr:hypothetical protein BJV78DRAFT_1170700 [Lactifluus subvellereus]